MIDPEVTAWCPRGDHADSGLLFGDADGVVFGAAPSFGKGWHLAGHHPVAGTGSSWLATRAGARWSPCGRQGCQRMVNGQLTDSTQRRRSVIRFSTCCCAPSKYLPASSNPASHPEPTDLRPAPTGFTKSSMTAIALWRAETRSAPAC